MTLWPLLVLPLQSRWRVARFVLRRIARVETMPSLDRVVLENIIFRELCLSGETLSILFVGVYRYSAWYAPLLGGFPRISLFTVDPDPNAAAFGAPDRHAVARFEDYRGAPPASFDWIFINGVFGYGINSLEQKTDSLRQAARLLRPGAKLLMGFRDLPDFLDFVPAEFPLLTQDFAPEPIPGLGVHRHATGSPNAHTFLCYRRV